MKLPQGRHIESAHESERGKGKIRSRPPARYSPDSFGSSEDDSNGKLTSLTQLLLSALSNSSPTVGN